MGFDDEIDAARQRLKDAISADAEAFDAAGALQALLPRLKARIPSRRLSFTLGEDEGDTVIDVLHLPTDEVLGAIYAEDEEYVFESNLEEYFDDLVDEDAESFLQRLYETLRADLPKYEVESEEGAG